jgi:putative cell wall-binding protein
MTEANRPPRRRTRLLALLSAVSAFVALAPLSGVASADVTRRLEASDNVTAAIAWSQFTFAEGTADVALLAREDLFADSLASASAQAQFNAPLLLTASNTLDPRTLAELNRLGVEAVLVLGGTAAVSESVVAELEAAQFRTERVNGPTRIETAIAVALSSFPLTTQVVVARAYGGGDDPTRAFADTLATGNYAAATHMPIILTESDSLTDTVATYLRESAVEFVTVAGGADAVSEDVVAQINAILDEKGAEGDVTRLSGSNRFATAVAMAADLGMPSAAAANRVLLVEGQQPNAWASGFAAAIQSASIGAPLVLANGAMLPSETQDFVDDAGGRIPLVCGPFTDDAACDAAAQAMGNA